jgi:hypothetical protein
MDISTQFMATLSDTMQQLASMYPDCAVTQKHVAEFMKHVAEPRTITRSVQMWHRSMQPHYTALAQTKDTARLDGAMVTALRGNWFMAQMDMAGKWADPSFDDSRARFVDAIRVLNGLAFMQHSFLGKLTETLKPLAEKLTKAASATGGEAGVPNLAGLMGGLAEEDMARLLPQLMELLNGDTLMEVNRMLPHLAHVLGGKERLMGILETTLGGGEMGGEMGGIMAQMLGAMMGGGGGVAGGGLFGGAAGGVGGGEGAAGAGSGSGSSPVPPIPVEALTSTVRGIIEQIADPDNENGLNDLLSSFGVDVAGAAGAGEEGGEGGGAGGLKMDPDDILRAFQAIKDQFGEGGGMGDLAGMVRDKLASGDFDPNEIAQFAASALNVEGMQIGEEQLAAIRTLTQNMTAGMAAGRGGDEGEGEGEGEPDEPGERSEPDEPPAAADTSASL